MSELTDLQLCKRIAEIEGLPYRMNQGMYEPFVDVGIDDDVEEYNPLTDDALCFRLMVKYEIILIPVNENYGTGRLVGYNAFYKQLTDKIYLEELNPNKAICLAIIEASK